MGFEAGSWDLNECQLDTPNSARTKGHLAVVIVISIGNPARTEEKIQAINTKVD